MKSNTDVMSNEKKSDKKSKPPSETHTNVLIVGDESVPKTALIQYYIKGATDLEYIPQSELRETKVIANTNHTDFLHLIDTAGSEMYDRMRQHTYYTDRVDVIILTYNSTSSLKSIKDKWSEEPFPPNAIIMLVGVDGKKLFDETKQEPITKLSQEAKKLFKDKKYYFAECSLGNLESINAVFDTALKLGTGKMQDLSPEFKRIVNTIAIARTDPNSRLHSVPTDVLKLILQMTANELKTTYKQDAVNKIFKNPGPPPPTLRERFTNLFKRPPSKKDDDKNAKKDGNVRRLKN